MKCELIYDLLPMYIDGLTGEESNKEIEKHLKNCKECQRYYQEMTGEIAKTDIVDAEEVQDVQIIKKIKKRNRRKNIGILMTSILAVFLAAVCVVSQMYTELNYNDVKLDYGVKGDIVYFSMEPKSGYELLFSGSCSEPNSDIKVSAIRRIGNKQNNITVWESRIGTEEKPCRWTIEFKDKIIVIENGEKVEEKSK